MKLLLCCVPYDAGRSGISVYINSVVRELQAAGHELTLVLERDAVVFFPDYQKIVLPAFCRNPMFSMLYCLVVLRFRFRRGEYDRVLILAGNRRMIASKHPETLVTIHDLSQYHVQAKYDIFRMFYIKYILPHYVRKAAKIFAISRSTAEDLVKFWKIPAGKIEVNYNGIQRDHLPLGANDGAEKIVFYISRIEFPGKNHYNLIKAWEKLPPEIAGSYRLILAGQEWSGAEVVRQAAATSPYAGQIEFPGFISEETLESYYAHCRLYIFPSFYEGFGLSLVEAMACGAVCACSNNSSLGEIAGDAALTFDPSDIEAMAKAMERALVDGEMRKILRERGLRRSEQFNWKRHAERFTAPLDGSAEIFGVRFSTESMEEALARIAGMVHHGDRAHFCAFINADCLNKAFKDEGYRAILRGTDCTWADGVGAAIAARYLRTPVRDNVNGTDMLPHLCRAGYRIFLLGAAPGVAELAAEKLRQRFPQTVIAGVADGFFGDDNDRVIEQINHTKPEILLVALGCPKQERWISEHLPKLHCKVAIGVGGLFDFASERIPRAPMWMRRWRMEWVFRLYQEPRRLFRRYIIGNPVFLFRVFWFEKHHFE